MKIMKSAVAGTLESSDVYVVVEPNEGELIIEIQSVVYQQFADKIRESVMEVLKEYKIEEGKISLNDRGAIDCTIRARVETAILRAKEEK